MKFQSLIKYAIALASISSLHQNAIAEDIKRNYTLTGTIYLADKDLLNRDLKNFSKEDLKNLTRRPIEINLRRKSSVFSHGSYWRIGTQEVFGKRKNDFSFGWTSYKYDLKSQEISIILDKALAVSWDDWKPGEDKLFYNSRRYMKLVRNTTDLDLYAKTNEAIVFIPGKDTLTNIVPGEGKEFTFAEKILWPLLSTSKTAKRRYGLFTIHDSKYISQQLGGLLLAIVLTVKAK